VLTQDLVLDELGLVAVAVRRHDEVAGHRRCRGCTEPGPNEVEARVDGGRGACAGEDVVVVDVERGALHVDRGVLSDATGAIPLSNDSGSFSAAQVHETLMALLNSNWAAVVPTDAWIGAVQAGTILPRGNLVESAMAGRADA